MKELPLSTQRHAEKNLLFPQRPPRSLWLKGFSICEYLRPICYKYDEPLILP